MWSFLHKSYLRRRVSQKCYHKTGLCSDLCWHLDTIETPPPSTSQRGDEILTSTSATSLDQRIMAVLSPKNTMSQVWPIDIIIILTMNYGIVLIPSDVLCVQLLIFFYPRLHIPQFQSVWLKHFVQEFESEVLDSCQIKLFSTKRFTTPTRSSSGVDMLSWQRLFIGKRKGFDSVFHSCWRNTWKWVCVQFLVISLQGIPPPSPTLYLPVSAVVLLQLVLYQHLHYTVCSYLHRYSHILSTACHSNCINTNILR